MSNVSHASLTGADLHEPKGAASAASGTVYVANGLGGGSWTTLSALSGTVGKVEMFITPTVPSGYLECNGSEVLRSTYLDLFNAVTIQQTGIKNTGVSQISGLSDTSNMRPGYFIGGAGIPHGAGIISVDSPTQVTITVPATATGSGTVYVSSWALGNGNTTFNLPDLYSSGRFPRSRTSSVALGSYQSNVIKNHVHPFTTNTDGGGASTGTESATHTHNGVSFSTSFLQLGGTGQPVVNGTQATSTESATHTHTIPNHAHAGTTNNNTSGDTETRPEAISFLFCVKY